MYTYSCKFTEGVILKSPSGEGMVVVGGVGWRRTPHEQASNGYSDCCKLITTWHIARMGECF